MRCTALYQMQHMVGAVAAATKGGCRDRVQQWAGGAPPLNRRSLSALEAIQACIMPLLLHTLSADALHRTATQQVRLCATHRWLSGAHLAARVSVTPTQVGCCSGLPLTCLPPRCLRHACRPPRCYATVGPWPTNYTPPALDPLLATDRFSDNRYLKHCFEDTAPCHRPAHTRHHLPSRAGPQPRLPERPRLPVVYEKGRAATSAPKPQTPTLHCS